MHSYEPFANVDEMAKHSFFSVEEIEYRATSDIEYNQRMFEGMVINAIQHKAYHDNSEAVRAAMIVSESIDISKTWGSASKQDRNTHPYNNDARGLIK